MKSTVIICELSTRDGRRDVKKELENMGCRVVNIKDQ